MTEEPIGRGLLARRDQLRVLVAGTHRSGTSWMGNILLRHNQAHELYEPFSKLVGIRRVKHWYPISVDSQSLYHDIVESFFTTRNERIRIIVPQSNLRETLYKVIFPDKRRLMYNQALRNPPELLLIKDPLASMVAGHMICRFGFKVIYLVKHPFSFYDSLLRVGWHTSLPISDLLDQCASVFEESGFVNTNSHPSRAAAIWSLVNTQALRLKKQFPKNVMIVRHEDLCRDAQYVANEVANFLKIEYTLKMRQYVGRTSTGTSVLPNSRVIHEFDRNSAALPIRWKETLSSQDREALIRGTQIPCGVIYPEIDV